VESDNAKTERVVRILIAILYSIKHHLRSEWGSFIQGSAIVSDGQPASSSEYADLLPIGLESCEGDGLGIPLELSFFVERYIKIGFDKCWFHAPLASQLEVQLNTLVDAYGKMETIRITPLPVAHLYVTCTSF
jgi:putative membrane protein